MGRWAMSVLVLLAAAGLAEEDAPPRVEGAGECDGGWCRIAPGSFVMGSPRSEYGHPAAHVSEAQVTVTLTHPFLIQQHEATLGDWMDLTGLPNPIVPGEYGSGCDDPSCPVTGLTWFEAAILANAASKRHGLEACYQLEGCAMQPPDGEHGAMHKGITCQSVAMSHGRVYDCEGYRLPTEAEWEYAARAGTTTAYYGGDIVPQPDDDCHMQPGLVDTAWYCFNSGGALHPVGLKKHNAFGLFDILGNAQEWCHNAAHYRGVGGAADGGVTDPLGALDRDRASRAYRGGGWNGLATYARAAASFGEARWDAAGLGVRLARTLPRRRAGHFGNAAE